MLGQGEKQALFETKMVKIYTLLQTKIIQKSYPLEPHIAI